MNERLPVGKQTKQEALLPDQVSSERFQWFLVWRCNRICTGLEFFYLNQSSIKVRASWLFRLRIHPPSKPHLHPLPVRTSSYLSVCCWALFVHVALLLSCSIDFWTLFSHDRIPSLTTSGSLHQIKSNKQKISLKPVSSFCAWKNMIYTLDTFFWACDRSHSEVDILVHVPNFQH